MTDTSLELEKLKIDAELKKEEFRQGVRKVIYGTMIVGVAAALFPFAQKVAESFFAAHIEDIRRESKLEILKEENRLAKELADKQNSLAINSYGIFLTLPHFSTHSKSCLAVERVRTLASSGNISCQSRFHPR